MFSNISVRYKGSTDDAALNRGVARFAADPAAAAAALKQWIETGAKPTPQSIAAACEELRASLNGACR